MGKKVRKQVTLTEEQAAALARRAKELGISEGELILRGIEYVCPSVDQEEERGPRNMDELIPWLRARAEKYPGTNQPRIWKREDAYEGRI